MWRRRHQKALLAMGIPEPEAHKELAKILCGCANPCSRRWKMKVEPSPICPFCDTGEEGTKEHMWWRCPAWAAQRAPYLVALRASGFEATEERRTGNPALWWLGIATEDEALHRAMAQIPRDDHEEVGVALAAEGEAMEEYETGPDGVDRVVLATDGSGYHPTDARLRRCGLPMLSSTTSCHDAARGSNALTICSTADPTGRGRRGTPWKHINECKRSPRHHPHPGKFS